MFACMRIACGGEDIEKNMDERTRDGVLLPFEAIYSLVSKSVCVCLSPLELPHNMLVKNCSLNIICIENSVQRSAGPIM